MAKRPNIPAPGGLAGRWVRTLVSLSVGVAIGLAPYLGTQNVPLFKSLLEMIPDDLRDSTIPLSAALMGIVAVALQWFDGERVSHRALRGWFLRTLAASIVALFFFMWVQATYVVTVRAAGGERSATFVVGTARLPTCGCPATVSDEQCIDGLSWRSAAVAQCWGDRAIRQASLIVRGSYLISTGLFGVLVGLLVLRPAVRRRT